MPRAVATLCVVEGLSAWNAKRQEIPNPRADERQATPLQVLGQVIQQGVSQVRRERPTLRRALRAGQKDRQVNGTSVIISRLMSVL